MTGCIQDDLKPKDKSSRRGRASRWQNTTAENKSDNNMLLNSPAYQILIWDGYPHQFEAMPPKTAGQGI